MGPEIDDVRRYKPFVDGLRAIAILTVVASHVGLPGLAGGYVGVDIFFVISGYLIIGQIEADVATGRFSFLDFAARRALRILPAFLLVMVTCLVLVSTVFLQFDYDEFSASFLQSALMLANHYFLGHQGYFDTDAVAKPLLHMWSLSVEEQFYLVAPLAIVTLYAATRGLSERAAQHTRDLVAAVAALASFVACIALTYGISHNAAFYVMPTRGWEFILGGNAVAAVPLLHRYPARVTDFVALAGVAAIAYAVVSFDAATYYPTFRAAFPVLGTTAIIACGIAAPGNIVARALSTPPMVAIGLVSYSWYLWHWPLLSFLRTSDFIGLRDALAAAALALVLAALTYRFVERPIRAWRRSARPRSLPVTATMISACVLIGVTGYAWSRYGLQHLLPQITDRAPLAALQGPLPPIARRGVILGDSHASVLTTPLAEHARRAGAELIAKNQPGCPPLLGVDIIIHSSEIDAACKKFLGSIDFAGVEFAIIAARWSVYLGPPQLESHMPAPELISQQPGDAEPPIALMRRGLTALLARARQAGVQRILLVVPPPQFPVHPPSCVVRAVRRGTDTCSIPRSAEAQDIHRAETIAVLRDVAGASAGVRVLDPIEAFCTASKCSPYSGLTLFYWDSNHVSPAGAERVFEEYRSDFEWAFGAASGIAARTEPAARAP